MDSIPIRIIIVLSLDGIQSCDETLGSPENIESRTSGSGAPIPTPAPASSMNNNNNNYRPNPYMKPEMPLNKSSAAVVREDPNMNVIDIAALNPYPGARWTIKARVTNRTPIKHWSNARGEGKLFSFELLDRAGGEIRATMFNDAVDKYYDQMCPSATFYFSGGKVKIANRKFSSLNNEYELSFDANADIRPAPEDASISQMNYNFKKIAALETLPGDSTIDLIGIVKDVGNCMELTSKAGKELKKRDLVLVDDSEAEVKVTLWEARAMEDCSPWLDQVLAIKGCRVSEYNGRSIGTYSSSVFNVNPDISESGQLFNWYANGGKQSATKSMSSSSGLGTLYLHVFILNIHTFIFTYSHIYLLNFT